MLQFLRRVPSAAPRAARPLSTMAGRGGAGRPPGARQPQSPPQQQKPQGIIGAEEVKRQQQKPRAPPSAAAAPAAPPQQVVIDVDASNFEQVVLRSPVAVILDCWAEWCNPCKQLTPRLEAVAKAARGAIILAKLDVDKNPELSQQLGVRSLPTVYGIVKGGAVDSFTGVVPDARLKEFIGKLLQSAEAAGAIPSSASQPQGPLEMAEEAVTAAGDMIDTGRYADALNMLPKVLQQLQGEEKAARAASEAAAKAAAPAATAASTSTSSTSQTTASSTARAKALVKAGAVPRELSELVARCVAALVRGFVVAGQEAARSSASGAAGGDAATYFAQAQAFADMLRTEYKAQLSLPDVTRALAAADVVKAAAAPSGGSGAGAGAGAGGAGAGGSGGGNSVAELTAAVAASPGDCGLRLRLAEVQAATGACEAAADSALEVLKREPGYGEGAARQFLVKLFHTLGPAHPVTTSRRKIMSKLLFR